MEVLGTFQRGATMVEYAFMVGLIALVAIGAVTLVGLETQGLFTTSADEITKAANQTPEEE